MKYFIFLLSLLVLPFTSFAAPGAPETSVWVTPANQTPGSDIELHAFIYNTEKQEITFTVSFQNEDKKEIAKGSTSIPPETAKAVIATWKQPESQTVLTAVVIKAVTNAKKDIPALHGAVGTVSIGGMEVEKPSTMSFALPSKESVHAFIGKYLASLESFRLRHAERFTTMRDTAKHEVGIITFDELTKVPSQEAPGDSSELIDPVETPNIFEYAKVIYATALASLFSNEAMFYAAVILLGFLVARFIFTRFI